ncbi:MAG TPA: sigma-70 family RNA polymerase sigma factor [Candidatus Limnocylindria bacterium]|jgi:RNA polymerase sigma-70 factor (ECF subfamily)
MSLGLVERAMDGDREAFSDLTRQSISRLYAIAYLILRDTDAAWDATQEAFVAAWRDLSALRDPDRFDAWLHRVLVRACRRHARRERRRRLVETHELQLERFVGADDIPRVMHRDQLERGFRRLGTDERAIVVLHHLEGFRLAEIGDILGLPTGTVKSRLHRSLRTMRAALEADARVITVSGERIA